MEEINASSELQTVSMEEITATTNKLGTLAEKLKNDLTDAVKSGDTDKDKVTKKVFKKY